MSDYKLVKQDIRMGNGALAYTRGQKIHVDAVDANDWGDYVVGEDTQEARSILTDLTGETFDEPVKQTRSSRTASTTDSGQDS